MGIGDQIHGLAEKALELHAAYAAMSANFSNLERQFDRLVAANERLVDRLDKQMSEIRSRVERLEGIAGSAYANATKEAMVHLAREHLAKHGSLPRMADAPSAEVSE